MASSLSNLVKEIDLAEEILKLNIITDAMIKNVRFAELNAKIATIHLNIKAFKIV